ncbi:MAG: FAD-dependent oxidoreductase, partial [Myxococcota bacterium]
MASSAESSFDVVIVGGGPGGYPAAIRARQLGLSVALVEREQLGGVCLNWGCIPTKALLRSSEIHHLLGRLDEFGFSASNISFDITKMVGRSRKVAKRLATGVKSLLKKNEVRVYDGCGRLAGPGKIQVEKDGASIAELTAANIILATGARARVPPGLESDGDRIWTYKEAMVPDAMPRSL